MQINWLQFGSRQEFGCYLLILAACTAGLMNVKWWAAVPIIAVLLLWASDFYDRICLRCRT